VKSSYDKSPMTKEERSVLERNPMGDQRP
jgi:hypothetical protein